MAQTEGLVVPVGVLGGLLGQSPTELERTGEQLAVGNDGTVRALAQRVCGGKRLDAHNNPRVHAWSATLRRAEPLTAAEARDVEPYLQMVVLDLLTANAARQWLWFDEATSVACLDDLRGAFPGFVAPMVLDTLLARVRPIRHFPAELEEALARFDRPAVEAALVAGEFAEWLVAPREVTDFLERRAALRTLVHARRRTAGH